MKLYYLSLFDRVIFKYEFVKIKFTNLVLFIIEIYKSFIMKPIIYY